MQEFLISLYYAAVAWTNNPSFIQQFVGFAAIVFVLHLCRKAIHNMRVNRRVSHQSRNERMFSTQQKNDGHRRAGGRCEFSTGMFGVSRCKNAARHGDHFYPYSRGGATTMQNFVSACEYHNLSKGAKMPSSFEKTRIENRRKNYFPVLTAKVAGEWA